MKNAKTNIFLIGLMGAGKSTIGRHLAEVLHKEFIDSDQVIEERTGVSISMIFDIEGEEGFRNREVAVIDELTQKQGIVLATGGGVVLRPENRKALIGRGQVIYLYAPADRLHQRTKQDRNRPLLQNVDDPRAKLEKLLEERDPLYRETADLTLETDNRPVQQAIPEIIKQLEAL